MFLRIWWWKKTTKTENNSKKNAHNRNWRCKKKKRRIEREREKEKLGRCGLKRQCLFHDGAIDVWKVQLDSRQKMWRDYWRLPRPPCTRTVELQLRTIWWIFYFSRVTLVSWVTTLESLKTCKKTFFGNFHSRKFLGNEICNLSDFLSLSFSQCIVAFKFNSAYLNEVLIMQHFAVGRDQTNSLRFISIIYFCPFIVFLHSSHIY